MRRLMSDYRDLYKGFAAAILGGGPSLPGDVARLPDPCLLIAVNYHAFHLVQADFVVYNDAPDADPRMEAFVYGERVDGLYRCPIRVSPDPSSDVNFDVEVWTGHYSSNTAAWFALWCGCDPVILCGMDCYQGEQKYFHEYSSDAPSWHYPLEDHLRPWMEEGRHRLPHVERVRVMSGPLTRIFPEFNHEIHGIHEIKKEKI